MGDQPKLAFNYASEFLKNILLVSAGSLTFILTFYEKVMPHQNNPHSICLAFIFLLAIILLLLSTFLALMSMNAMVTEIATVEMPSVMHNKIDTYARYSGYSLLLAFLLLILYVTSGIFFSLTSKPATTDITMQGGCITSIVSNPAGVSAIRKILCDNQQG